MIKPEELQKKLQNFRGSLVQYECPMSNLNFSEGFRYFVEKAEAHWFLDIIASFFVSKLGIDFIKTNFGIIPDCSGQLKTDSYIVKLISNGWLGSIIISKTGESKNLLTEDYSDFPTNCPAGEWVFYLKPQELFNKRTTEFISSKMIISLPCEQLISRKGDK